MNIYGYITLTIAILFGLAVLTPIPIALWILTLKLIRDYKKN